MDLVERVASLSVALCFRTWPAYDLLEQWIEDSNDQGRQLEPPELAAAKGATKAGSDPNTGARPKEKAKKQKAAKDAKKTLGSS